MSGRKVEVRRVLEPGALLSSLVPRVRRSPELDLFPTENW